MATFRAVIARTIVDSGVGVPVVGCLSHASFEVVGGAAWALEQMAQHGEAMAGPLIEQGALQQLIDAHPRVAKQKKDVELQRKVKAATKALIRNACTSQSLEPFVDVKTPPKILRHLLKKVSAGFRAPCTMRCVRRGPMTVVAPCHHTTATVAA
jgi:hypothetical protein